MSRFRTHILIALAVAFLVLLLLSNGLAAFILEWLWLRDLGFSDVLVRSLTARLGLGLVAALGAGAFIYANAWWALRQTGGFSIVLPVEIGEQGVTRVLNRTLVHVLTLAGIVLLSIFIGLGASTQWEDALLFLNRSSFGYTDPLFDLDASFYIFTLAILDLPIGIAWTSAILATLISAAIYAMGGGVSFGENTGRRSDGPAMIRLGRPVRDHLALLAGFFLVLIGLEFYLRRFALLYDQGGLSAGPGYAVDHGTLPLLLLQSLAALAAAGLVAYGIRSQNLRPLVAAAVLVVGTSVLGSAVPSAIQQFQVEPNELTREQEYLGYHLDATRRAFGLAEVTERSLSGGSNLTRADIEANRTTLKSIRLWDAEPLLSTLKQIQEIGQYYEFGSVDNDRYRLDGELRQLMLSPRELLIGQLPEQAATWVNETLTYTHGYGVTVAPVNEVTDNGLPRLVVQDIPPKSLHEELEITRPELYFGEFMNQLVIAPSDNLEFDYPSGGQVENTQYEGKGGVAVGSLFRRILLAMREGTLKPLLATDINANSRALLYRNISERIYQIAPFLTLDPDPYLVIHKGRLVWIVDAYTHADRFPYSQNVRGLGNYLRNSVKITIDAYDGDTAFYIADPDDPIINAWAGAFPSLFQPLDAMPASLRDHIRYPPQLFALQSRLFQTYHVEQPADFYQREGEWNVPSIEGRRMVPYYMVMKLPGEASEEFILMIPFTPLNRPNLAAWMVARNDGERYGELVVYKFPQGSFVKGPAQITSQINQNSDISEKLTLWSQSGSQATLGTLLVIPIEESLIYVQPLYLRADSGSIPELERVIVTYEDDIVMEPTLEAALARIFPGEDGEMITGVTRPEDVLPREIPQTGAPREAAPTTALPADAREWADQAEDHYRAAQEAARQGDWATYGEEIDALGDAITKLRDSLNQ